MTSIGERIRPSISVVLPTFNSARFLSAAIESIRSQEWPTLEIIVVDDGSVDNTPDVLAQLGSSDLTTIKQTNAGPAAARNTGIKAAHAEWIAFQDADDVWLPGKLSAQFEQLHKTPGATFCYSGATFRYPDGKERAYGCNTRGGPLLFELLKGNMLPTSSLIVRRECFETTGLFDTELRAGEDWDLWLRLAAHFQSASVQRPLVSYLVWSYAQKYEIETLERCTLRPLDRLFSNVEILESWPRLTTLRPKVYAWQYSVLAKSHLRAGRAVDFCRLVAKALLSHPTALKYLANRRGLDWNW